MSSTASVVIGPTDNAPLTKPFWSFAGAIACSQLVEFFDFYTIGFVVSMISGPWGLTFGEDATILLATGVGTIGGSLLWGWMGDRWGRRPLLIASIVTFSLGTGLSALTPTGWWWMLALFRLVVGVGTGGTNTAGPPLMVEFTPGRHRTVFSGMFTVALVPVGGLITSIVVAAAGPALGFRGILLIGLLPMLEIIWIMRSVPESPRWLAGKGREDEARTAVNRLFGAGHLAETPARPAPARRSAHSYLGMIRHHRAFWSVVLLWLFTDTVFAGVGLWGPTVIKETMNVTAAGAARLFIIVTVGGFVGRMLVPLVAKRLGRRGAGIITGVFGGVLLALTGTVQAVFLGDVSLFMVFLVAGYLLADGSFTNIVPFTGEVWPSALRVHGQGLGNAIGGVGKILGPAALALFANTSDIVSPKATTAAITPAFIFFGAGILVCALVWWLIAPETNGRSLEEVAGEAEAVPVA